MNVYATAKIRNVVILGHGGAGKTTLVEAMAYLTGITTRMGNVADGNTISDYDKEEQSRQFSISTSVIPVIRKDVKINILDAPGYFDFVGEAEEAAAAADAAVIVINGNNMDCVLSAFEKARSVKDQPTVIIAETTKGKGVSFMENKAVWHHKVPTAEEYALAKQELADKISALKEEEA